MKRIIVADTDRSKLQKIYEIAEEMVELLNNNSISQVELYNYKQYAEIDSIGVIDIYIDGDWKHDHLRADWLIEENFKLIKHYSEELEDTGGDWGPEVHHYYIYLPSYE